MVKNLPASAADTSSIPGSGRFPGGGNGMCVYACLCVCVCVCVWAHIYMYIFCSNFNLIKCALLSKVGHFLFRKILTKLKLILLEQRIIKPTRNLIYSLIKHFKDLWKKKYKKAKNHNRIY